MTKATSSRRSGSRPSKTPSQGSGRGNEVVTFEGDFTAMSHVGQQRGEAPTSGKSFRDPGFGFHCRQQFILEASATFRSKVIADELIHGPFASGVGGPLAPAVRDVRTARHGCRPSTSSQGSRSIWMVACWISYWTCSIPATLARTVSKSAPFESSTCADRL